MCINTTLLSSWAIFPADHNAGIVYNDTDFNFTFFVTNLGTINGPSNTFSIWVEWFDDIGVTSIVPSHFTLANYGDIQQIEITGTWDVEVGPIGVSIIDIQDSDNPPLGPSFYVYYHCLGYSGIEDHILITSASTNFTEGDLLTYSAQFIDYNPPDLIEDWNLKLRLLSNEGHYYYLDINDNQYNNMVSWTIYAPQLPANLIFRRNNEGQIIGNFKITGIDYDEFENYAGGVIEINKVPDKSTIHIERLSSTSVEISYFNSGGTENFIYYDSNSGPPYDGFDIDQGNSPINNGSNTSIVLTGLDPCTNYYFSGKGFNTLGYSDYWDEKEVILFESINQAAVVYFTRDITMSQV